MTVLSANYTAGQVATFGRLIENMPQEKYRGGPQVWDIEQGPDGYVYFAAGLDLSVWDGIRWSSYTIGKGMTLRSLACDAASGRLYCAGDNFYGYWTKNRFGDFNFTFLYENGDISQSDIFWRTIYTPDAVYFQTHEKIIAYLPTGEEHREIAAGEQIGYLLQSGEELYAQCNGKLYRLDGMRRHDTGIEVEDRAVCLAGGEDGMRIVTEKMGILVYRDGRLTELNPQSGRFFSQMRVFSAAALPGGGFLVGTVLNGAYITDAAGIITEKFDEQAGLEYTTVLGLMSMPDGDVWLGLDGGIAYIADNPRERYYKSVERKIGNVYTCITDGGTLYAGTNKGLFAIRDDRSAHFVPGTQGQVWDLVRCGNDIIAVHDRGLMRLSGESRVEVLSPDCWRIEPWNGHPDIFLISDSYGLAIYRVNRGRLVFSHRITDYSVARSNPAIDKYGNIWINGLQNSVRRLITDKDRRRVESNRTYPMPRAGGWISMFMLDGDVVFNAGGQCYTYDPLHDTIVTNDYYTELCSAFKSEQPNIYQSGNDFFNYAADGITVMQRRVGQLTVPIRIFEGVGFNAIPAGFRKIKQLGEGVVAVGYTDGVALYDTSAEEYRRCGDTIALRRLTYSLYGDERQEPLADGQTNVTLPYGADNIRLWLTGISRYEDFFWSIDSGSWQASPAGEYLQIGYLKSGDHTVVVRDARRDRTEWQLELEITRHFTSSWWFSSLMLLCGFGMVLLIRSFYLRRVRNIAERYAAQQREALEKARVEHENQLLSIELRERDRKLMGFTMNDITINKMLDRIDTDLSKVAADVPQASAKTAELKRTIEHFRRSNGSWQAFESYFDSLHDGFLKKLSGSYPRLTNNDLKICAYIKLGMSTKQIAAILNIEVASVESARYRLRKNLGLPQSESLTAFLAAI